MLRYIALSWDARCDLTQHFVKTIKRKIVESLGSWSRVLEASGLAVYCVGGPCQVFRSNASSAVILGVLFSPPTALMDDSAGRAAVLTAQQAAQFMATDGRSLVAGWWGCYVALSHDDRQMRTVAVKGPMSDLACLHTVHDGVHVLFSRMEDYIALGLFPISLNWDYIG